jgi:excisionase family DNA binding protein
MKRCAELSEFLIPMSANNSNERLMKFLTASPEQQQRIDEILEGRMPSAPKAASGPLLLGMGQGAKFLGVSRPTLWRMIKAGRLAKVEVLEGSFRLRRADLELLAAGSSRTAADGKGGGR